ncbi:Peptide-N(4)-(N-acetyl-beta-glucosaminyl)asparagine amidase [Aphelenchoides bicaudatus]|nr:Peptide-N(4)-(N-acetyl-beta-glucosaminyl)asparagine amidase [Aphelenchoides bicaudatus]
MCYKQLRRYAYLLVFAFFGSVFIVIRKLESGEHDGLPFETAPHAVVEEATFPEKLKRYSKPKQLKIEVDFVYCGVEIESLANNSSFPDCLDKLKWMQKGWNSHKCYKENGVNGSLCSFYEYMARIEKHCPIPDTWSNNAQQYKAMEVPKNPQLNSLFALMNDSEENYEFIKSRVERLWPNWQETRIQLVQKKPAVETRTAKNIFLYLGFLNKESGKMSFAQASKNGGPLGELVQWSDLIASMWTLGHNLQIHTTWSSARQALQQYQKTATPCPQTGEIDLIFIDIIGLQKIKKLLKSFYVDNWCRFRVLDSFGTHAEFNQPQYFRSNFKKYGTKLKSNPLGRQCFLTLYPHTDDNVFLGFVVETHPISDQIKRENITVVYGKEAYMWENASRILNVAARYTKIHGTVENYKSAVEHAQMEFENHGLLSALEFNQLLQRAKVFLGLGFPLEGPAALEAISNGAIFIQPRFDPPKSRTTYKFFSEKPTMRKITSQNPYMERFVGYPYVLTVNFDDEEELDKAYKEALQLNPTPTLPFEFSFYGMLERVDVILTNLNFCVKHSTWPPFDKVSRVVVGNAGESCQTACSRNGYLCQRTFFQHINNEETLGRKYGCTDIKQVGEPTAPSLCTLQTDPYLFSCATDPPSDVKRLCPCRTFNKNQSILCEGC